MALLIGAGLGLLARRSFTAAALVFAVFGIAGFLAAQRDPLASTILVGTATLISIGVGLWVLSWLLQGGERVTTTGMPDWSRRSFLLRAGSLGAAGVVAGLAGRSLLVRQTVAPDVGSVTIPPASETVAPLASDADLSPTIPELTPIVMPNERFYRIDTSLLTPDVDAATWNLRIHGLVDRETTLTYDELVGLPLFEQYVTIACVSNEVGDNLVGNAKWTGVRLREVLDMAGVQAGATQLVGRSIDGWTAGMPTAWVMDPAREPMIAVKMNDVPLPPNHGYPARLIVPGLYGYVSATKWVTELELTTLEAFDAYWVPRGWAKEAPILTQSRIDTPGPGRRRRRGACPGRRDRLGAGSRREQGRGRHRWRLQRSAALAPHLRYDLGPVGGLLGRDARPAPHLGPGDRRQRARPSPNSAPRRPPTVPAAGTRSRCSSTDAARRTGTPTPMHRSVAVSV